MVAQSVRPATALPSREAAIGETFLAGDLLAPAALRLPEPPSSVELLAVGRSWYARGKAVFDFLVALTLFLPALPVLLLLGLLVKLTSRGPALYSQLRLGRDGRTFTIYKLRTMYPGGHTKGAYWSQQDDPRVTPLGRLLRLTHLDELPQLWNVLKGDMSLVGPRPEFVEFASALERAVPIYRDRLQVRPGVTGLAQVLLPPVSDFASVRRKAAYDLYYVRHLSCWLDFRILVCTALHLFNLPCHGIGRILIRAGGEALPDEEAEQPVAAPQPQTALS
jgi:lipopolysaccharide/colanic/teichoic acid biosynthesis glycosyltransferase